MSLPKVKVKTMIPRTLHRRTCRRGRVVHLVPDDEDAALCGLSPQPHKLEPRWHRPIAGPRAKTCTACIVAKLETDLVAP